MSNDYRLLSPHEYCIFVTFAAATVLPGWRKVTLPKAVLHGVCLDVKLCKSGQRTPEASQMSFSFL